MSHDLDRPSADHPTRPARPPLNGVALVFGVIFVCAAGGWFLLEHRILGVVDLQWAIPGVLGLAGVVGVLASLHNGRRSRR